MQYHVEGDASILIIIVDVLFMMTRELTRMYKTYAAKFTLTYDTLTPFVTSLLMQQKPC